MKAVLSCALVLAAALAAAATKPPDDEKSVRAALQKLLDASARLDVDAVEGMHLYHPGFRKFDEGGGATKDGATVKREERDALMRVKWFRGEAESLDVSVFGNTAITTFVFHYTVDPGTGPAQGRSRATIVWVKDGGRWKVAHEHLSPFTARPSALE